MLRPLEGKYVFSENNYPICDCSLTNGMPLTDKMTEIAPCVHTYFELLSNISIMVRWLRHNGLIGANYYMIYVGQGYRLYGE